MPRAWGDDYDGADTAPRKFLTLTPTQCMLVDAWYDGSFTNNPPSRGTFRL